MNFLALNAGSGSVKLSLYVLPSAATPLPADPPSARWTGELNATAPGLAKGKLHVEFKTDDGRPGHQEEWPDDLRRSERVKRLLAGLWEGPAAVLDGPDDIAATGHRVVHGGDEFERAVLIDGKVEEAIRRFAAFAPLHNQTSLEGIDEAHQILGPGVPQYAVFDTAFHRSLPEAAATYAGPLAWRERGIRRYGFHGTSYRYASHRAARMLGRAAEDPALALIICHLGGGCSMCATTGGRSVDTTMGFTPLDGVPMCTRSGAVDPGILLYLMRADGLDADALEKLLNKGSGLAGLSGLPGDTRTIRQEADGGNERARLALNIFTHNLGKGAGSMLASLGGRRPTALVFTGGIGESEPSIREAVCRSLGACGVAVDPERNRAHSSAERDVAAGGSAARVLVIPARENWQIASEVHALGAQ